MISRHKASTAMAAMALLSACGPSDNDPGPGGVSVGEARALDEAAEMIEARRLPPETLGTAAPETEAATGDGAQEETSE